MQYLEVQGKGTRLAEGRCLLDGSVPRKPKASLLQLSLVALGAGQGLQLAPTQFEVQVRILSCLQLMAMDIGVEDRICALQLSLLAVGVLVL